MKKIILKTVFVTALAWRNFNQNALALSREGFFRGK
jgi:hypothetical protein